MGYQAEGPAGPVVRQLHINAAALVTVWGVAGLILNAGHYWLLQSIWLGADLLLGLHCLLGLSLLVWLFVAKQHTRRCAVAMVVLLPAFFFLSEQMAFVAARGQFDHVLATIRAGADASGIRGVRYNPASPSMVAFDWVRGIPDGGLAVVHDPGDIVAGVNKDNWPTITPGLANLLNGQPESCDRIGDPHYYMCMFQ